MSPLVGSPEPAVDRSSRTVGSRPRPGMALRRGRFADERAPVRVVLVREKRVEGHVAIAVERVAIRERELFALGDDVDELG